MKTTKSKKKPVITTKALDYRKCFNRQLDGGWDWTVCIWLTSVGMFADCEIKSPTGRILDTKQEAAENMDKVLKELFPNRKMNVI